ncbi:MAG: type II toxin-antitoxin system HicA family toxin [Planctomycetota bacterium]
MKRRLLEKHLKDHGCVFDHSGGRHDIWFNPSNGKQAPVPRHNEVNNFTAASICKQLGIPKPHLG